MSPLQHRIATETIEHELDGVNTVIAQAGQPIPLAFDHLVPDSKSEQADSTAVRSTAGRRAAAAEREGANAEDAKPKRSARKTDDDEK